MIFRRKAANMADGWDSLRSALRLDDALAGKRPLNEATVYTCVKILSETVGKLPIKIYQSKDGGQQQVDHYLKPLLKFRMNPYMSAIDGWKCLETQRNLYGNAYAWLEVSPSTGKIRGIYPLDSRNMTVVVDDAGLFRSSQRLWYRYTDNIGREHWINPDELLHFKGLTLDGLIGLSAVETLRMAVENAQSSSTFLNSSYKNGLTVSGVLQYVGDLNSEGQENMRRSFEQMSTGLMNANRVAVMPFGTKFEPFQMKLTDAQFLENARFTVQQLTAAFGIKPHQVNDLTKASYASVSESNREFYTDTMMSILTMYEQEIAYKCFLDEEIQDGFYVKFNADAITRGDQEKRMTMLAAMVQNMVATPNECRALEDKPPLAGGDELYGNAALVPARLLAEGAALNKGGTTDAHSGA